MSYESYVYRLQTNREFTHENCLLEDDPFPFGKTKHNLAGVNRGLVEGIMPIGSMYGIYIYIYTYMNGWCLW